MTWHVQFTSPDGIVEVRRFPDPERAIEAACLLLDDGSDVFGIGTGPLTDSIDRREIKRIYDVRQVDKVMYIKADKELEYSKVVDATDMAAKNGVRVVGLIGEQKTGTVSTVAGDSKAPGAKH